MNPKYLYLTVNFFTIIIPLMASFYPKAPFYKKWKYLWPAILLPAFFFIAWDEVFTQMGIWGFNPKYLTGIQIASLPLEEILFFICIPYASLFTYFALNHLIENDFLFPHQDLISSVLSIALLVSGLYYIERAYTGLTFILLGLLLAYQILKLRPRYMGRFYVAFAFLLIPFVVVNGILTGSMIDEPVVWYDNSETLGIRIGTIPFEDIFYGMLLILTNVIVFEWLEERERFKAWTKA